MKTVTSKYVPEISSMSLAQVNNELAQLPVTGKIDQINWPELYPTAPQSNFVLVHTNDMLFIRYEVKGEIPLSTKTQDLELVNEDACVEVFIANEDNTHYWNFEFNAAGVCNASFRKERKVDVVRLNSDQLQSIKRYPQQYCSSHWSLLVGIPLSLIQFDLSREHARRANIYKCGDKTLMKHYASWSPIQAPAPAFHLPEFFGEIQF